MKHAAILKGTLMSLKERASHLFVIVHYESCLLPWWSLLYDYLFFLTLMVIFPFSDSNSLCCCLLILSGDSMIIVIKTDCLKMECLSWHFTLFFFNTRNTAERKHINFKCHCLVFHTTSTPSLCMQAIRTSYHWYSKQGHIDFWFSWNSDSAEHFFDLPVCSAFFSLALCLSLPLSLSLSYSCVVLLYLSRFIIKKVLKQPWLFMHVYSCEMFYVFACLFPFYLFTFLIFSQTIRCKRCFSKTKRMFALQNIQDTRWSTLSVCHKLLDMMKLKAQPALKSRRVFPLSV